MLNVCFVSPYAWPILSGATNDTTVGGAELKLVTFAKALAAKGHRVSMVVLDFGQADALKVHGLTVFKAHREHAGVPGLRFFYPRLTSVCSALSKTEARCFVQSSCGALTGIVSYFAKQMNRRFVYLAASDADFDHELPLIRHARDRWLYRKGLSHAHRILVQTERQNTALESFLGFRAKILPNTLEEPKPSSVSIGQSVLWAGRMIALKRPDLYVQLALQMPHIEFVMCGGTEDELRKVLGKCGISFSNLPSNLKVSGAIPYSKIDQYFDRAALLVNTSDFEGFPNTFLQAWARKLPTLSFFDIGFGDLADLSPLIAKDLKDMIGKVDSLMRNEPMRKELGQRCRDYFDVNHRMSAVIPLLENALQEE